jgi:DnaJ-domain-containing protein 1
MWDRLGNVIKSYLNDEAGRIPDRPPSGGDPDLDAAWEELDELLKPGSRSQSRNGDTGAGNRSSGEPDRTPQSGSPPEVLRPDFAELGLPFGASAADCKAAYKRLLKKHHPDRHAGHEGDLKAATEKAARINAAYDRIERWRAGKK